MGKLPLKRDRLSFDWELIIPFIMIAYVTFVVVFAIVLWALGKVPGH